MLTYTHFMLKVFMQICKSLSAKGRTFNKSHGGLLHKYSYVTVSSTLAFLPSCLAQTQKTTVRLFTMQAPRMNHPTDDNVQSRHKATSSGDNAWNALCSPHKGIIPVNDYTLSLHPVLLQVIVTWDNHPKTSKLRFRGFQLNKASVTGAPLDTAPTFKHQQHAEAMMNSQYLVGLNSSVNYVSDSVTCF